MKKTSINTIIFDWDGTLHNTSHLYGEAFRYTYSWLVENGYASPKEYRDEETSIYLGMTAKDMWEAFRPDLPTDIKQKAGSMLGQRMDELISAGEAILYDGVTQMLDMLKQSGYKLVILSNCRHAYLEEHRKVFNLDKWFDGYYAAQDYDFVPKEKIFEYIKESFSGEYVMIGDRKSDIIVGTVQKIRTIGCNYGFGSSDELIDADYTVNSIEELCDKILMLN